MKCLIVSTVLLATLAIVECRSDRGSSRRCYTKKNNKGVELIDGAMTIQNVGTNKGQFKKKCREACDDYESNNCFYYEISEDNSVCRLYPSTPGSKDMLVNSEAELYMFECRGEEGSCSPECVGDTICETTRTGSGNDCGCKSQCVPKPQTDPEFKIGFLFNVVEASPPIEDCDEDVIEGNVKQRLEVSASVKIGTLNNFFRICSDDGSDLFVNQPVTSVIKDGTGVVEVDFKYVLTQKKCLCILGNAGQLEDYLDGMVSGNSGIFNIPGDDSCPRVNAYRVELRCLDA